SGERRRRRVFQSAGTGRGIVDCRADADYSTGIPEPDSKPGAERSGDIAGSPAGRAIGALGRTGDPEYRATHPADGESDQPVARTKSGSDIARAFVDGAGAAAVGAFRLAVGAPGAETGYSRRRTKAHRSERHDWCRAGRVLSENQLDGISG